MGELKPECREAVTELYHFLDGQLTDERRSTIRRHLDDCPPCGGAFDFESELRAVIARNCRDEVPESLRRRIAESIGLAPPDAADADTPAT